MGSSDDKLRDHIWKVKGPAILSVTLLFVIGIKDFYSKIKSYCGY